MAEVISIPRPVLHQEVVQRLRQRLIEGAIAPGAKLNERELSEQLQVSRTPLREAIKALAAEGLVELLPNRGAVAALLSAEDVAHTFELIAGLEAQSGELAAARIDTAELAEIRAVHYEMLAAYTRRDLSAYYRLNAQIHDRINAAARNPVLQRTYVQVNARLQALRFRSNFDERKWQRAVAEHEAMIECLAARDAGGMRTLMLQHLQHKRDAVLELMHEGRSAQALMQEARPPAGQGHATQADWPAPAIAPTRSPSPSTRPSPSPRRAGAGARA
jgi:DNA-binding GntR family transcriptional regulator